MASKRAKHVVFSDGKWAVKSEGSSRANGPWCATKLEAVRHARALAKRDKVRLVIHGRDGRIQEVDSYEHIPTRKKLAGVGR